MPNWEEIKEEYETSKLTFKQLSEKFGLPESTIKSRKQRDKWIRPDATGKTQRVQTQGDAGGSTFEENPDLTEKQRLFCLNYIKSFNGTMAAKKAGYALDSAHVTGSQLLRNPKIRDEIKRMKGEVQNELMVGPMDVVNIYLKIAMADITEYVKFGKNDEVMIDGHTGQPLRYKNGDIKRNTFNYVDFEDWDKIDGTVISEVKQGKDGISVKLADRTKALEFLTKYFDMVPDAYKDRILDIKSEELELRKQETESRHGEPDKPDITDYLNALRGNVEAVFDDE